MKKPIFITPYIILDLIVGACIGFFILHTLPVKEQKEKMDFAFESWRGNEPQTDDVKDKVYLDNIHKAIAASGYDTENVKANDEAYANLPACCQYTRK